jgi:hypothetical protein
MPQTLRCAPHHRSHCRCFENFQKKTIGIRFVRLLMMILRKNLQS